MDQKFTIAFYCSSVSWGGLEMNIFKRALWMKERGHHVFLYCVKDSLLHKEAIDQLEIQLINRNKKGLDLKNARALKKSFVAKNIQFVWCTDKRDISVLGSAKKMSSNAFKLVYQQQMQFGIPKKDWWHTRIFRRIDIWIAPLNYLKDQVKEQTKFPIDRVHVIPLTMDIDQFINALPTRIEAREYFNLKESDVVVGMMGRIDYAKSQQFVKDVVSEIMPSYSNLKMLMVGNKTEGEWADYYDHLLRDIQENHADGSIQIYPFMKKIGLFYQAIDIFVMASKNETFGMVTVEAMLAGKKIAGTNAAGTKELLHDGKHGYYFNWIDAPSLKKALIEILDHPDEANKKAETARVYAASAFSHISECEKIEEIFTHSS
ncbi:MAG: glycosyltransferase family 4 protein [Crocinitomicaceae bacterium]